MPTSLRARWTSLGLGGDTQDLNPTPTITPHTFARAAGVSTAPPPASLLTLPYIPLAMPGDRASSTALAGSGAADLQVAGVLGEGGMGRVLLARQRSLGREVAVKVAKPGTEGATLDALLVEALITGSLEHPGIVPIHALGCDDEGRPVLIMKRIEGVSWRDLCRDERHPGWARIDATSDDRLGAQIEILMQVCSAVHFAHGKGIVHRDVKPSNVMIGASGEVYVVDWGIAVRIGEPSGATLVGTPAYMAPEMVWGDGQLVDARTDVYLLGATLHNVLTGEPRHRGETLIDVMLAASESLSQAYGPDVPHELAAICNKATSADPAERHPSALAFRRALADYLRHRGSIALSDGAAAQLAEIRGEAGGLPIAPGRLRQLMTECRFGFMQALRAWRENAAARAGLGECLAEMIAHEIAQENREGAAALLAELPEPRPDLEGRLAALDAEIGGRRERDARLLTLEREHDPSVGARTRSLVLGGFALGMVLVSAMARYGPRTVGPRDLVTYALVLNGVLAVGLALGHKRALSTQAGRLGVGIFFVWSVAALGHRVLAARAGTPVEDVLLIDMWLAASLGVVGAFIMPRMLAPTASLCVAGTLAIVWRPDLSIANSSAVGILVVLSVLLSALRQIK